MTRKRERRLPRCLPRDFAEPGNDPGLTWTRGAAQPAPAPAPRSSEGDHARDEPVDLVRAYLAPYALNPSNEWFDAETGQFQASPEHDAVGGGTTGLIEAALCLLGGRARRVRDPIPRTGGRCKPMGGGGGMW